MANCIPDSLTCNQGDVRSMVAQRMKFLSTILHVKSTNKKLCRVRGQFQEIRFLNFGVDSGSRVPSAREFAIQFDVAVIEFAHASLKRFV